MALAIFFMIVGFAMYYFWVHSVVIVCKKIKGVTRYEKVVLSMGLAGFVLILLSTIMN